MKTLTRQVVRIETAANKNGEQYERAIIMTKDGEQKLPLFGNLVTQIQVPGAYEIQYDDTSKFWKAVSAKLLSEGAAVATVAGNGSKSTQDRAGAIKNQNARDALKDRQIAAAVILKATSEYLAAIAARGRLDAPAGPTDAHAMETEAHHAFKVFQNLLEAYVADKKPDFENVEF